MTNLKVKRIFNSKNTIDNLIDIIIDKEIDIYFQEKYNFNKETFFAENYSLKEVS
ncbi:hypothetical protein G6Z18_09190 [Clostridium perfringens]|uniref:hypothetical protein n=1 Tax=Clostridium perfringens TaxID=1502 RepID=UPI000DA3974E|nr:hypothetical protein [Clostridium perfringens]EHK2427629.1 hypothetical protein [Clostridium perfringens]MBO3394518.1 hypothetical protein [Clostridium perfringens]MBO3401320.1 hypothetical protein [Clostridium perfringens]MCX0363764.1 hypothetical protein [Clostridium perfringens]MDH2462155.1 hypothetical protein [Clostridium perfringens]